MYRLEIFNQALEPVDVAAIPETTEIVDDFVTLETYEIIVPKIVDVERGHILRFMENNAELALGVVVEAEQTKETTRITAAPIISLLDFDTLEPAQKFERTLPYPPVWLTCATNYLLSDGLTQFNHKQTAYIQMQDTGAFLVSALAVKLRDYILGGGSDPTYTINGWDVKTSDRYTTSNTVIDGMSSDIASLYNPDNNENQLFKTANLFDVFTASRNIEGRTFKSYFDFTGDRTRLCIDIRRSPSNTMTIDADAQNIINKEINITTDSGATNRCIIYLCQKQGRYTLTTLDVRRYYRHPDGTIDQTASDLIAPAITSEIWVDYDPKKTTAENEQYCDDLAAAQLTVAEQSNKISLTVTRDDRVLDFDTMRALSSATVMHGGRTYTAQYTGCKIAGELVTYMFGDVRTDLTSKLAIANREKQKGKTNDPFDEWDAAVPTGYALTSNNGIPQISGGSVSAVSAYGAYIIANVGGLGYTSVRRTNGQGNIKTIRYDGTTTQNNVTTLTIDSGTKWVIAHRTASSQAVLSLSFS